MDLASQIYQVLVLENPAFKNSLLAKKLLYFLETNKKHSGLNFDEWENLPLFLKEFSEGLQNYNQTDSCYPSVFDNFVKIVNSNINYNN